MSRIGGGDPVRIFVPFVNEGMAQKFFIGSPHLSGYDIHLIDNRRRGAGLPQLYNEIIARHLEEDCWLFFVHEDFEVQGEMFDAGKLPPQAVYGTFGVRLKDRVPVAFGEHKCSAKDGSDVQLVGVPLKAPTWVETLDCQSILLHTSTLRKYPRLRFDEELTFDLYAEELCLKAQEHFGLPVMVVPLKFQHYSFGKVTERYWRGLRHLARRYPKTAAPGTCSFLGGRAAELEAHFTYDITANPLEQRLAREHGRG